MFQTAADAREAGLNLLRRLEPHFLPDTAGPSGAAKTPSAGHCAVVALIFHRLYGGEFVSSIVDGVSHWFNRVVVEGRPYDLDITGAQFGAEPIRLAPAGELYAGTRVRGWREILPETVARAAVLAERGGLDDIALAFHRVVDEWRVRRSQRAGGPD